MNSNKNTLCNKCCESQYAYIGEEYIYITKYIDSSRLPISCRFGHELYLANGKKNKPHFRHKNPEDIGGNNMTNWHIEWQGNFPVTEVNFLKQSTEQIKNRRDNKSSLQNLNTMFLQY